MALNERISTQKMGMPTITGTVGDAILDKHGHCELIGTGWSRVNGVWYSNESYKERTYTPVTTTSYYPTLIDWSYSNVAWEDALDEEDKFVCARYETYDSCIDEDGYYDFDKLEDGFGCPEAEFGDASYCEYCKGFGKCYCESEVAK